MSVRVVLAALGFAAAMNAGSAVADMRDDDAVAAHASTHSGANSGSVAGSGLTGFEALPAQIEERALAELAGGAGALVISPTQTRAEIRFDLPPNLSATEAWLTLAARPSSDLSTGVIAVSINGGDPINIRPEPRAMQARFALYSADLRPGLNRLTVDYHAEATSTGWILDTRASNLRLTLEPFAAISSLAELDQALAADFAAPRRIALIADNGPQRAALEALTVQGLALRAGRVPLFTGDIASADLIVRLASRDRLSAQDAGALHAAANGPQIALRPGAPEAAPRLVVTGRNPDEAAAAARLLAARAFTGFERHFLASDAMSAERLGEPLIRDARAIVPADADLSTLASSGLPFAADQGARTAVHFAVSDTEDRYGALSLMARASLATGQAWLYAWYGEAATPAPADHHLLVIGPDALQSAEIERSAPAELRAALRAAERRLGRRGAMGFAAAAYADEADRQRAEPGEGLGVAALFHDQRHPGRWIAALTAPADTRFDLAGGSLARSDLWAALEGRAALWSNRGVTPYDFSVARLPWTARLQDIAVDHLANFALALMILAGLVALRAVMRRRRRVHALSNASR